MIETFSYRLSTSLRKKPTFGDATARFPAKWRVRNERRNSILITRHTDLGSACDWLNQIFDAVRPIRSSTQIWVVTRLQYGISALVSETSFGGETSGSVAKCRLFSQVNYPPKSRPRTVHGLGVVTYLNYHVLSCSCAAIPQNKIRQ